MINELGRPAGEHRRRPQEAPAGGLYISYMFSIMNMSYIDLYVINWRNVQSYILNWFIIAYYIII